MKYRHRYHAGNFADVHKHVTLLALIAALQRKDKGFLYLDTHAGRGAYDLSTPTAEAQAGVARLAACAPVAAELRAYLAALDALRARLQQPHLYGGSPLLALQALRPQDRAVLLELQGGEAHHLEQNLARLVTALPPDAAQARVERADGWQRLRAHLPPRERRGLTCLDPPYEESGADFAAVSHALLECLQRFPTGVVLAWYPIKDERETRAWLAAVAATLRAPLLVSELWLFPRDSRVALNGSGLVIANAPHRMLEATQLWLPELCSHLARHPGAGSSARMLSQSAP
jgi:23S rRNA (adenine2030-N6)-methyltransferase